MSAFGNRLKDPKHRNIRRLFILFQNRQEWYINFDGSSYINCLIKRDDKNLFKYDIQFGMRRKLK